MPNLKTQTITRSLLLPAVCICTLLSCARTVTPQEVPAPDQEPYALTEMTISVGTATRTVNNGDNTNWTNGDALSVLYIPSTGQEVSTWASKFDWTGQGNQFTGMVYDLDVVTDWYAIYPYAKTYYGTTVSLACPSTQTQKGDDNKAHFAGADFPMYGVASAVKPGSAPTFTMQHVLSGIAFDVTNTAGSPITVTEITLTSTERISGKFTLDMIEGTVSLAEDALSTVSLKVENASPIAANGTARFYAGIAPVSAGKDLSVKVTAQDANGHKYVYEHAYALSSEVVFQSGVIRSLDVQFAVPLVDLGTFNLENPYVSAYLTAAESQYTNNVEDMTSSIVQTYSNYDSARKDIPNPVWVSWGSSVSGPVDVVVYEDDALSEQVLRQQAAAGENSVAIYNLIPGRTYYYTVSAAGTVAEKGFFKTEGRRRMIKVSDVESVGRANNCRDLGGLPTTDGKHIKYGYIYRGTNMDATTAEEKDLIVNFLHVGLDNELRAGDHVDDGYYNNRYNVFAGTGYNVDYIAPGYGGVGDLNNGTKMKQTIQGFIDAAKAGKASYFHCRVGADRTGYVGLLLESALGVPFQYSLMDFELTSFSSPVGTRQGYTSEFFKGCLNQLNTQEGNSLQEKATKYLISIGISAQDIQDFREIVLE